MDDYKHLEKFYVVQLEDCPDCNGTGTISYGPGSPQLIYRTCKGLKRIPSGYIPLAEVLPAILSLT